MKTTHLRSCLAAASSACLLFSFSEMELPSSRLIVSLCVIEPIDSRDVRLERFEHLKTSTIVDSEAREKE